MKKNLLFWTNPMIFSLLRAAIAISLAVVFLLSSIIWPIPQALAVTSETGTGNGEKSVIAPDAKGRRVILVIIDRISWQDIREAKAPYLQQLIDKGSIGLMNTRTAESRLPGHTYITIGAGSRLAGGTVAEMAFNAGEELADGTMAGDLYRRRTGFRASPGSAVHVNLAQLAALNDKYHYPAQLGAIGTSLHNASLKTAVLGNADTNDESPRRQAVTIAMDDKGLVDYGLVDKTAVKTDKYAVTGRRTDYRAILEGFLKIKDKASLVVIETGDTSRLGEVSNQALGAVILKQRKEAILEADRFLSRLARELDWGKDRLIIITPTPTSGNLNDHLWLTPVIMAGQGVGPGVLTSGTTKREGIVSNIDIAATIVDYLGLPVNPNIIGRPMGGMASNLTVADLEELSGKAAFTHRARPILVKGYVLMQIIVLVVAMVTVFWRKPKPRFMTPVLLWLMAVPAVLLLLPLLPQPAVWVSALDTVAIAALMVWISLKLGQNHNLYPFITICLVTVTVILGDTITGSNLTKSSVLGYDAMEGARYYGIGNEYMGILIGAAIIGSTGMLQVLYAGRASKLSLVATGLFYTSIIYILAAPNLGTNVGGTIAALAGFGVTMFLLLGFSPNRRMFVSLIFGIATIITGLIIYDINRSPEVQSHIGRTATALIRGSWQEGIAEALDIIVRKLEINLKLIKYTMWSRVFITSIIALAILFYRPVGIMKVLQAKFKLLYIGFIGIIVGSIVALVFNDSGIVAAATMMIFGSAPLISLVIKERPA